jgi:hypothetical protein
MSIGAAQSPVSVEVWAAPSASSHVQVSPLRSTVQSSHELV